MTSRMNSMGANQNTVEDSALLASGVTGLPGSAGLKINVDILLTSPKETHRLLRISKNVTLW